MLNTSEHTQKNTTKQIRGKAKKIYNFSISINAEQNKTQKHNKLIKWIFNTQNYTEQMP